MTDTPETGLNAEREEELRKDQRIMRMMRKVLGSVIKDATPQPGMAHPLSQETLDGIKDCFGLIAAREQELAGMLGFDSELRPYYTDETRKTKFVSIDNLTRRPKK
jgi:hypothetical protein